jgi:exoribonuclease-2
MSAPHFDLASAAYQEMLHDGFAPDFPPGTDAQLAAIRSRPAAAPDESLRDLRGLLWSSIDNDNSRDLDQIEFAERVDNGIKISIGVADVDGSVDRDSPLDRHAQSQTTTVYTAVRIFPMLPEQLSTDLTSLAENEDRAALVIEFVVDGAGCLVSSDIYRALVRNQFQLTYSGTGPWLEGTGPAVPKLAGSAGLQEQLKIQHEAAALLREQRHRLGALNFDRIETEAVMQNGQVQDVTARKKSSADFLIEDFMIAANEVMAKTLGDAGVSSIRRVVKSPERWARIVELAARYNEKLPDQPDSGALDAFLQKRKAADEVHYPDLSLSVMKLMGPGEYTLARAGDSGQGHFGLAAHDYTHSTAPNRRFADLVTQRLIKAVIAKQPPPYSDEDLDAIAQNCTAKENAARKVERAMDKRVAAVAFHNRIGQTFHAVVTGVSPKGVFVRALNPPVDGRLMSGQAGVDVGDQIDVKLLSTDPQRGFIDFGR